MNQQDRSTWRRILTWMDRIARARQRGGNAGNRRGATVRRSDRVYWTGRKPLRLGEERAVRATEAVDRLVGVPDYEASRVCDDREDGATEEPPCVLKLVQEYEWKPAPNDIEHRRSVLPVQNRGREVLAVGVRHTARLRPESALRAQHVTLKVRGHPSTPPYVPLTNASGASSVPRRK